MTCHIVSYPGMEVQWHGVVMACSGMIVPCRTLAWHTVLSCGLSCRAMGCHVVHWYAMAVTGPGVSCHCMVVAELGVACSGMACLGRSWHSVLCHAEAWYAIQWCACVVACFGLA